MARLVGTGPVTLGGAALADLAKWSVDLETETEEVADLGSSFQKRVVVSGGWTAKLEFEFAEPVRNVGAISAGGWNGIEVKEWSFKAECKIEECTGAADVWQVHQCVNGDWGLEAEKWEATTSYKVFIAMLQSQVGNAALVNVNCPFGVGLGAINKGSIEASDNPLSEKLTVQSAGGSLISQNPFVAAVIQQCDNVRQYGYANPALLVTPRGQGQAFIKSVESKIAKKWTMSVDLQGTGAWN